MSWNRRLLQVGIGAVGAGGAGGYYILSKPELTRRTFADSPSFTHDTPEATNRASNIQAMKQRYSSPDTPMDMLVIGGGATGSGIVLDAATRGLKVALVEKEDYACGASSKSTKLLHGGVRYLQKAVFHLDPEQLSLVMEALKERSIVLHQAPHLCAPIGTILPCYSFYDYPLYWVGLKFYDALAAMGHGTLDFNSSGLSAMEAKEILPSLAMVRKQDGSHLRGGIVYYDGQMNDSRVNVSAVMTAAKYGALVSNYLAAVHVEPSKAVVVDGETGEKSPTERTPVAVTLRDENGGPNAETFTVYTKCLVNSTGPWTDHTRTLVSDSRQKSVRLMEPQQGDELGDVRIYKTEAELLDAKHSHLNHEVKKSRGVHVTLPREYCKDKGLIIPSTKDGRIVFLLPWEGVSIAGTTDEGLKNSYGQVPADHQPTLKEVDFILDSIEDYCDITVKDGDIKSIWCGLRPLALPPGTDGQSSQNVVREHVVACDPKRGIVTIAGGKWTTYRKMAEDVVDAALKGIPALSSSVATDSKTPRSCVTDHVVFAGGNVKKGTRGFNDEDSVAELTRKLAAAPEVVGGQRKNTAVTDAATSTNISDTDVATHLLSQYGTLAHSIADTPSLAGQTKKRLHPDHPLTEGEVRYLARHEQAYRASDILSRRTRISFQDVAAAKALVPKVVEILASEHSWSPSQQADQRALAYKHLESFDIKAIPEFDKEMNLERARASGVHRRQ